MLANSKSAVLKPSKNTGKDYLIFWLFILFFSNQVETSVKHKHISFMIDVCTDSYILSYYYLVQFLFSLILYYHFRQIFIISECH